MAKQITAFSVLAVILGLLFWWPRSDWRSQGQSYLAARLERNLRQLATANQGEVSPPDIIRLEELYDLIADSELDPRLDRLADSLLALRQELAGYHDILLSMREAARKASREKNEDFSARYFSTVRLLSRLENQTQRLAAGVDSLKGGLEAVEELKDYSEIVGRGIYQIRRLTPERVPVRELCTRHMAQITWAVHSGPGNSLCAPVDSAMQSIPQ